MADDPLEKGMNHQSEGPGLSVLDCDFVWSKLNDEQREAILVSNFPISYAIRAIYQPFEIFMAIEERKYVFSSRKRFSGD